VADKKDILTSCNWKPGDDAFLPAPKSEADANKLAAQKNPTLLEITWYMWLKKEK
jgi:hypothetical protein